MEIAAEKKEPFLELHRILGALKQRDLIPALRYTNGLDAMLLRDMCIIEFHDFLIFIYIVLVLNKFILRVETCFCSLVAIFIYFVNFFL